MSRPTVIDRVKRLEAEGILEGYVRPGEPGLRPEAQRMLRGRAPQDDDDALERDFLKALQDEPDVLEAYTVAGEDCLLLKIVADTPTGVHDRLKRIRTLATRSPPAPPSCCAPTS